MKAPKDEGRKKDPKTEAMMTALTQALKQGLEMKRQLPILPVDKKMVVVMLL